jgi:putative membrane protein insertion efficiency factor
VLERLMISIVRLYRVTISSWTPPTCRFTPTCSAYAIEAIERHGSAKGGWLTLRRIGRCHPWGGQGFDQVPAREDEEQIGLTDDPDSPARPDGLVAG